MAEGKGFGPLKGVTVADMTQYQQGSVCTRMLAEMGAEVIKIESRLRGDPGRGLGAITQHGLPTYFEETCRNKKSITLDFQKDKGKEILYKLVEKADVFAENFRVGVAERRGFGYDDLRRINPSIVYVKMTAWGLKGPSAELPGYDGIGQAIGGIASTVGEEGQTMVTLRAAIADQTGAFLGAYGVLLALFHRERTGKGQMVDGSLIGGQIALLGWTMEQYLLAGVGLARRKNRVYGGKNFSITAHFDTRDGKSLLVQLPSEDRRRAFFRALGREELTDDPQFDTGDKINEDSHTYFGPIEELFLTKDLAEWLKVLREHDVVCAPINDLAGAACYPDVIANDYVTEVDHPKAGQIKVVGLPIKLSETPGRVGVAPELGQHTEEILKRFGYTSAKIAELREEEVI